MKIGRLAEALVCNYVANADPVRIPDAPQGDYWYIVVSPKDVLAYHGIDKFAFGKVKGSTKGQSRIMQAIRNYLNEMAFRYDRGTYLL